MARVGDRRLISGIIVALQSGDRWIDLLAGYGPRKTLYNRFARWSKKGVWQEVFTTLAAADGPQAEVLRDRTHIKAHLCAAGGKRGFKAQALGINRGGRTTKIHALSDGLGRPLASLLTSGQAADCQAAEHLLHSLVPATLVMADRAYDTSAFRKQIEGQCAVPNILPKRTRVRKSCFSLVPYRGRNPIEQMFCRLMRRGPRGVKLVISDAHEGLKVAIRWVMGPSWQRYRVHWMRNAQVYVGRAQQT